MEETDKTYMWLVIITFLALALAIVLAGVEKSELSQPLSSDYSSNPF